MKRSILACLAGLLTWAVVVTVINRVLRLSLPNYTAAEHALQFTLAMKWARLSDGNRDLARSWCRNRLDIFIQALGAVNRRQRRAGDVRALAHRQLEQISRVVSPDIFADDHSGGARGCAAPPRRNKNLNEVYVGTEMKLHR